MQHDGQEGQHSPEGVWLQQVPLAIGAVGNACADGALTALGNAATTNAAIQIMRFMMMAPWLSRMKSRAKTAQRAVTRSKCAANDD
jgi:hypothetical protein